MELFKLELMHMTNQIKIKEIKLKNDDYQPNEITENIINGKIVEIVFNTAVKAIENIDFKVKLLKLCKGASNIEDMILQ